MDIFSTCCADADIEKAPDLSWFPSRAPFPWMGSKGRMAQTIIDLFPPHEGYVEPFGGTGTILLKKRASTVEVYNDASQWLTNFFRVLQNDDQRQALLDRLEWTPYSRIEYETALDVLDDPDPVTQAWALFVAQGQGFGGAGALQRAKSSWGISRIRDQNTAFRNRATKLLSIAKRLRDVVIEHDDALAVIQRWDAKDTLFFLDPPYVDVTRVGKKGITSKKAQYQVETDDDFHIRLANLLLTLKGKVLLSGYASPIYAPLEDAGWERKEYALELQASGHTRKQAGERDSRMRTECVWLSPSVQRHQMENRQMTMALY